VSSAAPALYLPDWDPDTADASRDILRAAVQRLWRMQRRDGSFGYWGGSDRVSVSGSVLALEFLLEAREAEVEVHAPALNAGLDWLEEWMRQAWWGQWQSARPHEYQRALPSACVVLARAGRLDPGWVQRLREHRDNLDAAGRIQAAEAMVQAGYRPMAMEMLRGLTTVENGGWGWYSRTSENANLLRVLLRVDPDDGRIADLARAILEDRNERGRWRHTYENAAVIRAMTAYANRYGQGTGKLEAHLEMEGATRPVMEGHPVGLAADARGRLVNLGKGVVYVEEQVEGIPLSPPTVDPAFELDRTLLTLEGAPVDPDRIRSGDVLFMRIRVKGLPRPTGHLVIDQRMPAGLEPLPLAAQREARKRLRYKPDFRLETPRHLEARDDRVLIFPNQIGMEETSFPVLVRAVTPGGYRFPALFAQDMYEESVQARGMESRIQVVP
jgi:uncharacterized protein YfaS (alpha-2-macroglobulin family)